MQSLLADDLQRLLEGQLDETAFRNRHSPPWHGAVIETIMANVEHFLADSDIRARDPAYREVQESEMRKLIALLRGERLDEAQRITFLGSNMTAVGEQG
jgi:hypothetical protein